MPMPVSTPHSAEERLRRIEVVTDAALAHLDVEDLLVELLDRVRELLDVDTAAVLLHDASAQRLVATAAAGIEEEVRQGVSIPIGQGFAGRIAAEKQPVILERVDHTTVLNPILWEKKIRSLLGVPLMAGGAVIGVLHVGALTTRRFTDQDINLLQLVADRIALATQARLSGVERAAAAALQRGLLPARLPTVPGMEFAARYVPGEESGVGGDWYDVFNLPAGWLGIVIGDVVGRGLPAAVVMGRLRSALRAYALEGHDPGEVLSKLDRQVQHFEPDTMATVAYAMLEPSLDRLHLSSAGHLAPVLALPHRPATFLDVPIDPPIGAGISRRQRRTSMFDVPPGALLCFYTDGLVERRGSSLDVGLDRLCESVVARSADSLCAALMAKLVGAHPPSDDIALLAIRHQDTAEIDPLDLVVPAVPESLRDIRAAVRRWLPAVGAEPHDIADLLVAVGEACANAVEHAYGPGGGTVAVHLEIQSPDLRATVRDTGSWRPPRGENRGRGTRLMRECSDELHIAHDPDGTSVFIRRRLTGQ